MTHMHNALPCRTLTPRFHPVLPWRAKQHLQGVWPHDTAQAPSVEEARQRCEAVTRQLAELPVGPSPDVSPFTVG